jgi:hypothetical protein
MRRLLRPPILALFLMCLAGAPPLARDLAPIHYTIRFPDPAS